jgi:hypothetical protein
VHPAGADHLEVEMPEPSAIEIKLNIAGDVDQARSALGLDSGKKRKVWFLDDLTDGARPTLPLLSAGIVLRLRRRDSGKEDSTVKMRPCRWSQLVSPWDVPLTRDPDFRVEGDWSCTRHVLAASQVADIDEGTIERAISDSDRIGDAFTQAQLNFLADCGEIRVALHGVTALDPIAATQWKDFSLGGLDEVTAERWTVAGLDFLELSVRVSGGAAEATARQRALIEEVLARGLTVDDSEESKTLRVMKRVAGLD